MNTPTKLTPCDYDTNNVYHTPKASKPLAPPKPGKSSNINRNFNFDDYTESLMNSNPINDSYDDLMLKKSSQMVFETNDLNNNLNYVEPKHKTIYRTK